MHTGLQFVNPVDEGAAPGTTDQGSVSPATAGPNSRPVAQRGQVAKREELIGKEWPGEAWRAFAAASAATIEYLIHVYLQVAYPM